jgi:hypothetical protein
MKVVPLIVVMHKLMVVLPQNEKKIVFRLVFFVGVGGEGEKAVKRD